MANQKWTQLASRSSHSSKSFLLNYGILACANVYLERAALIHSSFSESDARFATWGSMDSHRRAADLIAESVICFSDISHVVLSWDSSIASRCGGSGVGTTTSDGHRVVILHFFIGIGSPWRLWADCSSDATGSPLLLLLVSVVVVLGLIVVILAIIVTTDAEWWCTTWLMMDSHGCATNFVTENIEGLSDASHIIIVTTLHFLFW